MIKRNIELKIKELAQQYPVLSLTGPRQSGKTTLLKNIFPNYTYVSLEDKNIREFAQNDPTLFLETYPSPVILDEVQRAPDLFSYIQTIVDTRNTPGQYILSGSQNFLLLESITQTLAGRVGIFKLLPFSISELKQENQLPSLDSILYKGCYPPIYDKKIAPNNWYEDYIETYIQRDIREIKSISNLGNFKKFLTLCALRSGQTVNFSSLGRDCGISHSTAQEWISILETSYIIFFLQPYTTHLSNRIIKSPKLYFYDTGLLSFLLRIPNEKSIVTHEKRGILFETLIVSEIIKNHFNSKKPFYGYFLRDREGHEIDLIIEKEKTTEFIEIKSSKTVSSKFFQTINYFKKKAKNPDKYISKIIYGGSIPQKRTDGTILPWC